MENLQPQFERTHILLGDAGIAMLASKHVFVAGLGGVGSYCAEALARAGIGRLTSTASCRHCSPPWASPRRN
jgi:tRNA A37 threonylcarbamoyladenosine dehydratase